MMAQKQRDMMSDLKNSPASQDIEFWKPTMTAVLDILKKEC